MNKILLIVWLFLHQAAIGNTVAAWIEQGDNHEMQGRTREAMECFEKALKLEPVNVEIMWRLSKQLCDLMPQAQSNEVRKELGARALAYSRRALDANPASEKAHLALAVCLGKNLDFFPNKTKVIMATEIKKAAETAIQINPKSDLGHHLLGRWHYENTQMNRLLRSLAVQLYGGLPSCSLTAAADSMQKAAELNPRRVIHQYYLGVIYLAQKNKPQAIKRFQIAVTLTPQDKDDQVTLDLARLELNRLKK